MAFLPDLAISDWSVSRRINVITAGLAVAVLLVGCVGLFSTSRVARMLTLYQAETGHLLSLPHLQEQVRALEQAERNYSVTTTAEDAAPATVHLDAARQSIESLRSLADRDPRLDESLQETLAQLDGFATDFETVRDIKGAQAARAEAMIGIGNDLAAEIRAMRASLEAAPEVKPEAIQALTDTLLAFTWMRLASERFLVTGAEEDWEKVQEHQGQAEDMVKLSIRHVHAAEFRKPLRETKKQIKSYRTNVEDSIEGARAERDLHARTRARVQQIDGNIDSMVGILQGRQENLAHQADLARQLAVVLSVLFSVAALATGWYTARRIQVDTLVKMRSSTSEMQRLANGDLEITISNSGSPNEFGEMARALEVFRDNAVEARALAARQRDHEEAERHRKESEVEQRRADEAATAARVEEARRATLHELRSSVGAVVDAGAQGDFSRRISVDFSEPELADLAQSVNRLVDNVDTGLAEVVRVLDALASGDLSDRMTGEFHGAFAELQDNINQTFDRLGTLVADITAQCDQVSGRAAAMIEQAEELAGRAVRQAASLEETSAAMSQIAESTRSSAKDASGAARTAQGVSEQVQMADSVVSDAIGAMADISVASAKIDDIVGMIEDIAFRTNLLALNASVEAARAGPAGRGFAVVASEVRALAQRSSEASGDIKTLIDESAEQVARGVALVEKTGETLETIISSVSGTADTLLHLTEAANEQVTNVEEVTSSITELDSITQNNATLADQGRDAASDVGVQAQTMRTLVGWFRTAGEDRKGAIAAE